MKTVVFNSPFLDEGEFPDARVTLRRGVATQVTDEQAAILLTNPDVKVADAPAPAKASAAKAPSAPADAPAPSASSEVK